MKISSFWACFFGFASLLFYSIFLLIFSFCWIFMPTDVGLVFRLNYLFLACFSNLLACFCKITWHHWLAVILGAQRYGNYCTPRNQRLNRKSIVYTYFVKKWQPFIGVAFFCLLGLALRANLIGCKQQTKLLAKSLPSRLVSQLPSSGLIESVLLLFTWLSVAKWLIVKISQLLKQCAVIDR